MLEGLWVEGLAVRRERIGRVRIQNMRKIGEERKKIDEVNENNKYVGSPEDLGEPWAVCSVALRAEAWAEGMEVEWAAMLEVQWAVYSVVSRAEAWEAVWAGGSD